MNTTRELLDTAKNIYTLEKRNNVVMEREGGRARKRKIESGREFWKCIQYRFLYLSLEKRDNRGTPAYKNCNITT